MLANCQKYDKADILYQQIASSSYLVFAVNLLGQIKLIARADPAWFLPPICIAC